MGLLCQVLLRPVRWHVLHRWQNIYMPIRCGKCPLAWLNNATMMNANTVRNNQETRCNTYETLCNTCETPLKHYCNTYATQICDLKWFLDKNMRSQMVIGHSKHANRESLLLWEENGTFSKETWSGQRWVKLIIGFRVLGFRV